MSYANLTDKMKRSFFQAAVVSIFAVWMHYMDANETDGEKDWRQLHNNAPNNIEQVLEATPHIAAAIQPPTTHHVNYQSLTNQTFRTLLET